MLIFRALTFFLAFVFFTEALQAAPTRVSPETMRLLLQDPRVKHTSILLAANQTPEEAAKKKQEEEEEKKKAEPQPEIDPEPRSSDVGVFGHLNFGNMGDSETALIFFALVGAVVVIAWVPYFPVLLYQSISGEKDLTRIHQFSFQHLLTNSGGNDSLRRGSLTGGRYSLFLKDNNADDLLTLGLSVEGGYYSLRERNQTASRRLLGGYWLLGPSILMGAHEGGVFPYFAKLDLLAGTSFDSDLGLISRADLTLGSYLFGSNMSVGLGIGGLYLHAKEGQGIFSDGRELGLLFTGSVGYSF